MQDFASALEEASLSTPSASQDGQGMAPMILSLVTPASPGCQSQDSAEDFCIIIRANQRASMSFLPLGYIGTMLSERFQALSKYRQWCVKKRTFSTGCDRFWHRAETHEQMVCLTMTDHLLYRTTERSLVFQERGVNPLLRSAESVRANVSLGAVPTPLSGLLWRLSRACAGSHLRLGTCI